MTYVRRTPRRSARPDEIRLMRELAAGPKIIDRGPLGRCLKRGWCTWLDAPKLSVQAAVALTPAGLIAAGLQPASGAS